MDNHYETIAFETEGKILRLWLNRPDQHNALNRRMVQELTTFFRNLEDVRDIRVVMLRGRGTSFCAGADLKWMQSSIHLSAANNLQETRELSDMFEAVYKSRKIVIALAQGNIYGGGNGLLAACDLVYCTDNSGFSLSETRIGLVAATISPYLLHRISPARLRELVLTARRFDGREAEASGLANRSFPTAEEMELYALRQAEAILGGGPQSISTSKRLINQLSDYRFPTGIHDMMAKILAETRTSREAQEGMTAFLEKRKPDLTQKADKPDNTIETDAPAEENSNSQPG